MAKKQIGAKTYLYPMPTVLVGAAVGGRPNYLAVAYIGIAQHAPPMIAFAIAKRHHTTPGIRETGTFSVNIPSEDQVAVTDYCGLVSGSRVDKSALFTTFYGKLATAPMIAECPLNLECRLVQALDYGGTNELLVGEIVETYAEERCLTDGLPDIRKIRPFVLSMHDNNYWKVGEHLAHRPANTLAFERRCIRSGFVALPQHTRQYASVARLAGRGASTLSVRQAICGTVR